MIIVAAFIPRADNSPHYDPVSQRFWWSRQAASLSSAFRRSSKSPGTSTSSAIIPRYFFYLFSRICSAGLLPMSYSGGICICSGLCPFPVRRLPTEAGLWSLRLLISGRAALRVSMVRKGTVCPLRRIPPTACR